MTYRRPIFGLVALCAASWVAGCSVLDPKPDYSRTYVLHALTAKTAPAPPPDPTLMLAVFLPDLPDVLAGQQMVTRLNANEVNLDEFHRWAEPLDNGFSRVLAQDISLFSDSTHVAATPLPPGFGQHFEIYIKVLQFDGKTRGDVTLQAQWRMTGPEGKPNYLMHETTFVRHVASGTDPSAEYAEALSALIGDLARAIVEAAPEARTASATLPAATP